MKELLAFMCLVDWLADDLHYKSTGNGFYGKHLLADRIRDLGDDDALKEAYWLGFKDELPPDDAEIAKMAINAYTKISTDQSTSVLQKLFDAFTFVIQQVEMCKQEAGLPGGVHSILDGISQKALTYKFLVKHEG